MIPRLIEATLLKSTKSVLLLGPRQVGKSTLLSNLKPDLQIDLSDEKTFLDFSSNPNEINEQLAHRKCRSVFVDEIQRLPSLLNTLQAIIDSNGTHLKFYLSGSSPRKLKRGQANLLPGRIFSYQLAPLCSAELGHELDVMSALRYGTLPEVYVSKDSAFKEKLLSTYSAIYLKEEIQAEALTRNLTGFSRFLFAAALYASQILDFSKLAKQARIERKLCTRFFEILEDTLIAQRVEVFEHTRGDVIKRPKFYFFDIGVLNGLLENFSVSADRKGYLLEHLVYNQLRNSAIARDRPIKIYYFRTRGGLEVDFIVEYQQKTFAIEVRSGQVSESDTKGLQAFRELYPAVTKLFLVSLSAAPKKIKGVIVCTLSELLQEMGL